MPRISIFQLLLSVMTRFLPAVQVLLCQPFHWQLCCLWSITMPKICQAGVHSRSQCHLQQWMIALLPLKVGIFIFPPSDPLVSSPWAKRLHGPGRRLYPGQDRAHRGLQGSPARAVLVRRNGSSRSWTVLRRWWVPVMVMKEQIKYIWAMYIANQA